jgi:hypothetical protein
VRNKASLAGRFSSGLILTAAPSRSIGASHIRSKPDSPRQPGLFRPERAATPEDSRWLNPNYAMRLSALARSLNVLAFCAFAIALAETSLVSASSEGPGAGPTSFARANGTTDHRIRETLDPPGGRWQSETSRHRLKFRRTSYRLVWRKREEGACHQLRRYPEQLDGRDHSDEGHDPKHDLT